MSTLRHGDCANTATSGLLTTAIAVGKIAAAHIVTPTSNTTRPTHCSSHLHYRHLVIDVICCGCVLSSYQRILASAPSQQPFSTSVNSSLSRRANTPPDWGGCSACIGTGNAAHRFRRLTFRSSLPRPSPSADCCPALISLSSPCLPVRRPSPTSTRQSDRLNSTSAVWSIRTTDSTKSTHSHHHTTHTPPRPHIGLSCIVSVSHSECVACVVLFCCCVWQALSRNERMMHQRVWKMKTLSEQSLNHHTAATHSHLLILLSTLTPPPSPLSSLSLSAQSRPG